MAEESSEIIVAVVIALIVSAVVILAILILITILIIIVNIIITIIIVIIIIIVVIVVVVIIVIFLLDGSDLSNDEEIIVAARIPPLRNVTNGFLPGYTNDKKNISTTRGNTRIRPILLTYDVSL